MVTATRVSTLRYLSVSVVLRMGSETPIGSDVNKVEVLTGLTRVGERDDGHFLQGPVDI